MRTIVSFFRCSKCREHDVDLSRMCVRVLCPKEQEPFTEIRFIEAGSDFQANEVFPGALTAGDPQANEIDPTER